MGAKGQTVLIFLMLENEFMPVYERKHTVTVSLSGLFCVSAALSVSPVIIATSATCHPCTPEPSVCLTVQVCVSISVAVCISQCEAHRVCEAHTVF